MFWVNDYYQHVFALLHHELSLQRYEPEKPHPIRRRFWSLLSHRAYSPLEARPLVRSYSQSVERELIRIISKQSVAYWLHLYRRLAPLSIGEDKRPGTVHESRATLEAAIQKYAKLLPCNRIGLTKDVPLASILGGLLMGKEFDVEREALRKNNQLVLTNFTTNELKEFYDVERLAYEIWRSSAMLRIISKGAPIRVDASEHRVYDERSADLNNLVINFDRRAIGWSPYLLSSTGVVDAEYISSNSPKGQVFLPLYNYSRVSAETLNGIFSVLFNVNVQADFIPNFLWIPFDIGAYREAHLPFSEAFQQKHGVQLDAVLTVVTALCHHLYQDWQQRPLESLWRYWQRGYHGPHPEQTVRLAIDSYAAEAQKTLGIGTEDLPSVELMKAFDFFALRSDTRSNMSIDYAGPHNIFLPYNDGAIFVDYTWIFRRLFDLFIGVNIPDQNFKGDALEKLVRFKESVLPTGECRSFDNKSKQIDAAFAVGNRLIIVECKAISKSLGTVRGDPESLRYRTKQIESALNQVDDKAQWLAARAVGKNYDIRQFSDILPVVVTPFTEYIPSLAPRYWLNEVLPRVLTPLELKASLAETTLLDVKNNVVKVTECQR